MAAPIVITLPVTNVDKHSATSGGSIFSDGGETLSAYGVCWNTSGLPTLADPRTIDNSVSPFTGIGAVHVGVSLHGHGAYTAVAGATTYNVMNYGAAGNGTTNDAGAIRAAFLAAHAHSAAGAASTVYFPPGKTYFVSSGWDMPTIRTNDWVGATPTVQRSGIVRMSGYGATIKYANTTTRFCWLQAPNAATADSQWKTYGNLIVEGFTIDANYRQPTSEVGYVFWLHSGANADNITVRDVTTLDHVTHRTTSNQTAALCGIQIKGAFTSRSQAHTTFMTNITVDHCIIYAQGKGLDIVVGGGGGMATIGRNPLIIDDILLIDSTFDSCHHYGSNAMLGGYASGGTCTITRCTFNDSCDDGLEIDAFDSVTITDCIFHANRQPICHVWFSFPMSSGLPTWLIDGCVYSGRCNPYWEAATTTEPGPRSPMMPEVRKYAATAEFAPGDTRSWGNFTIQNCTMEFGVSNSYASHLNAFTIGSNGVPMESLTITNCDITDVGSGGTLIYVRQGSGKGRILPVSIHDVRWRSSTSGSYVLVPLSKCTFVGALSLSTDMS